METLNYNTIIRLSENMKKITNEEFNLLQAWNNEERYSDIESLERLINDFINKEFKFLKGISKNDYIAKKLKMTLDSWLDEDEKSEIIDNVIKAIDEDSFPEIYDFYNYEESNFYTVIYKDFDIEKFY